MRAGPSFLADTYSYRDRAGQHDHNIQLAPRDGLAVRLCAASGTGSDAAGTYPTGWPVADRRAATGRPWLAQACAARAARRVDTTSAPSRSCGHPGRDQPPSDLLAVADPVRPDAEVAVRLSARIGCGDGGGPLDHAAQRHLGAGLWRLSPGKFRRLCGTGWFAGVRHPRFRRDAACTI